MSGLLQEGNGIRMVFDTMVLAYGLLGVEDFREESLKAIEKAPAITVPELIRSELLNAVWQWVRSGRADPEAGRAVIEDAERLYTNIVPVSKLWPEAFGLALEHNHSPFDTLFIAAARLEKTKLLTYDAKLHELFPDDCIGVVEFIKL